jgi:hypothetical protein
VRAFRVSGDDRTIRGMADEPPEHDELDSVDDVAALRREAASRRRQLRRVEQERHVMIDVIEGYERATARGAAADRLANLEDLELALPLQDMRNATGPSPTRALPLRSTSSWRPVHIGPSRRHLSHRHARSSPPGPPQRGQGAGQGGSAAFVRPGAQGGPLTAQTNGTSAAAAVPATTAAATARTNERLQDGSAVSSLRCCTTRRLRAGSGPASGAAGCRAGAGVRAPEPRA